MAVSVWGPIDRAPAYAVLADVLDERIGGESAAMMRGPYTLGDPKRIAELLSGAGFADIEVEAVTHTVGHPSAEEFFRREVVSWLAAATGDLDQETRRLVVSDLQERLTPYLDDGGLAFPMEALIASGRKVE